MKNADTSFERSPRLSFYSLNSNGGDLETALKMGRLIRSSNYNRPVYVEKNSICLSSCVLILAAGMTRWVEGKVGIHRPYIVNDQATNSYAQRKQYETIEISIKKFLTDVNIASSLYDDMMRIPPTKVIILTQTELERYGLDQPDPYEDSAQIARIASSLKITSAEYIKRNQRAEQECNGLQNRDMRIKCNVNILEGK